MALWSMVSEKSVGGEYWSNRYVIDAETLGAATTIAADIRGIEREVHYDICSFTKYRVSDQIVGSDVYQVINDGVTGDLPLGSNEYLPLFCRVRVDFNTLGGGRPSRKYLCLPLPEANQAQGVLNPNSRAYVQDNYVALLLSTIGFVDVDGQLFGSGSVSPKVGMHQMRRGSRRKVTPIIP